MFLFFHHPTLPHCFENYCVYACRCRDFSKISNRVSTEVVHRRCRQHDWTHLLCSWCLMVTLFSDMMFVLHSSYRLFCCRLHHVGSACGWTRPDYCDYCSSHQSSRWENSHQHLFGLMNTKCQFTAEMLLCALFPREPETSEAFRCSSQSGKDQIRQELRSGSADSVYEPQQSVGRNTWSTFGIIYIYIHIHT